VDSDLCPFLITDDEESIFQRPIDEMIGQAVKCHLRCLRVSSINHDEMKIKDCALFHLTFYEILPHNTGNRVTELWPCGDLYSDGQQYPKKPRKIREAALTVSLKRYFNKAFVDFKHRLSPSLVARCQAQKPEQFSGP